MPAALVLFSGGQDSTTALFWALAPGPRGGGFDRVEALAFRYGQRHAVELEQARHIAGAAGVPLAVRDLTGLLAGSALLDGEAADTAAPHARAPHLPAAFVPGRNALFLAAAASHAFAQGLHTAGEGETAEGETSAGETGGDGTIHLVGGMCQADFSGYPDCRRGFVDAMAHAMALALDVPVRIHTPLMDLTKAETWKLAADLGAVRGVDVLEAVRELSHTDYHGDRSERHPWGYGRLDNPASVLRAKGYAEAEAQGWLRRDPHA